MPVVSEYEYHAITKKFRYATFFPYARSVDITAKRPEGVTAEVIAKSSSNSWAERQLNQRQVTFDKDKDKAGPIPLAAVVTVKPKTEEEKKKEENKEGKKKTPAEKSSTSSKEANQPKTESRLAVFGDSDFASNNYYNLSGNGNLFLNTVNWLSEEADLISIQPKTSSPKTIQLNPSQGRLIFFVSLIILPLLVFITGVSIWIRRRSL